MLTSVKRVLRVLILGFILGLAGTAATEASSIASVDYVETSLSGGLFQYGLTIHNLADPVADAGSDLYWLTLNFSPAISLVNSTEPIDWVTNGGAGFIDTFSLLPGASPAGSDIGPGQTLVGFNFVLSGKIGSSAFQAIFANPNDPDNPLVYDGRTTQSSTDLSPVPEPTTLLLLASGAGSLITARRRHRQRVTRAVRVLGIGLVLAGLSESSAFACDPYPNSTVVVCHTRGEFYAAAAAAGVTVMGVQTFNTAAAGNYPGGATFGQVTLSANDFEGGSLTVKQGSLLDGTVVSAKASFSMGVGGPVGRAIGLDFTTSANHQKQVRFGFVTVVAVPGFIGFVNTGQALPLGMSVDNFVIGEVITVDNVEYAGPDNTSPTDPRLPRICPEGTSGICFDGPPGSSWYDPPTTVGYRFKVLQGGFKAINDFPPGFGAPFTVTVGSVALGQFGPGQEVVFPPDTAEFLLTGITPAVDGSSPLAFPIKLTLDTPGATFAMQPLTAEEIAPPRMKGSGYNFPETPVYRATFAIDVTAGSSPAGTVTYAYSRTRMNFASTAINSITVTGTTVVVQGAGTVNGQAGYTFTATATDGAPDSLGFEIRRSNGTLYFSTASLALAGGNFTMSQ